MAKPRSKKPSNAAVIEEPYPDGAKCPFDGKPLRITHSASLNQWRAAGDFYFTKWFNSKRELMWHLLQRDGIGPDWASRVAIATKDGDDRKQEDAAERHVVDLKARDAEVANWVRENI